MSDVALRCESLGKRYRIGPREPYRALRDSLAGVLAAPLRRLRSVLGDSGAPRSAEGLMLWALRDVSFEVKHGDVVGIVGRNGAGKSTLLKILSRITEPTEGHAVIHGRVGSLLEVGTGFHTELTGRENVYLNGVILGMKRSEIRRKFDEIVAFAEVEKFIDTPVKHYSSGMYVRLAFAVAAHLETEILLVDEVLAVGDSEFQKKCIGKMSDISKAGRTVLFVSHNMMSLQTLCRQGILLSSGRKVLEGEIGAVIGRYLESARQQSGATSWASPEEAPGDERVRLKAVRIVCDGQTAGEVGMSKDFFVEVLYWNLQANGRRVVSIHLHNAIGVWILASANLPSACVAPDPWFGRPYPLGLFRTSCRIPGGLLNDGVHSVSVFINGSSRADDNIVVVKDVLAFAVRDTGEMRKEYGGPWLGAIRPRLGWVTEQVG